MKKKILLLLLFVSGLMNAQEHLLYKCKSITQRDSIATDLLNKGYSKYVCHEGIYLNFQSDNTFCFSASLMGYKEVTFTELYLNVKTIIPIEESKTNVKTLNDYLSSTDKFSGEKTYYGGGKTVSFMKVIGKGTSTQYVSVDVNGSTLNYGCYGVYILFENGKKIIRSNEKVETDYSNDGWRYKAFFRPTLNEITLLKTQKITTVKLYIYDEDVNESESNTILEDAKIILTTPKKK
jgi:hypothetical protein